MFFVLHTGNYMSLYQWNIKKMTIFIVATCELFIKLFTFQTIQLKLRSCVSIYIFTSRGLWRCIWHFLNKNFRILQCKLQATDATSTRTEYLIASQYTLHICAHHKTISLSNKSTVKI